MPERTSAATPGSWTEEQRARQAILSKLASRPPRPAEPPKKDGQK